MGSWVKTAGSRLATIRAGISFVPEKWSSARIPVGFAAQMSDQDLQQFESRGFRWWAVWVYATSYMLMFGLLIACLSAARCWVGSARDWCLSLRSRYLRFVGLVLPVVVRCFFSAIPWLFGWTGPRLAIGSSTSSCSRNSPGYMAAGQRVVRTLPRSGCSVCGDFTCEIEVANSILRYSAFVLPLRWCFSCIGQTRTGL